MVILKAAFTFKEQMPEEEQKKVLAQVVEVFKKVPGLKRKYFLADPKTGEAGGIYAFDNQEALEAYLKSDVWRDVVVANAKGEPKVETFVVLATTDAGVII